MPLTFVLGGARSGKSALAQQLAEAEVAGRGLRPLMIATAEALDDEMAARIARHREERGDAWRTLEVPYALPQALAGLGPEDVAVVDCLTLWLSNLMLAEAALEPAVDALLAAAAASRASLIMVANEVGLGVVPENALARRFRDEAGRLNRRVADQADRVRLIFAGQALTLKGG